MRAYLLGYNHGKDDGYFSTLIERGGCEKSYDESLDVEYVAIDEVLEIIDNDIKDIEAWEEGREIALPQMNGMLAQAKAFREAVLALKGEQE